MTNYWDDQGTKEPVIALLVQKKEDDLYLQIKVEKDISSKDDKRSA